MAGTAVTTVGGPLPSPGKKVYPDNRMSEGTLLFVDLSNVSVVQPGFLGNGTVIPNLAARTASSLTGVSDLSLLHPSLTVNFTPQQGFVELTAKKGVHIATSETETLTAKAAIVIPDAIKTYIRANPTHSYYISMQRRVTKRRVTATDYQRFRISRVTANTANNLFIFRVTATNPITGQPTNIGVNPVGTPGQDYEVGERYRSIGVNSWTGIVAETNAAMLADYQVQAGSGSEILYNLFIEDLTVSGRTYAQVDAIDKAKFDKNFYNAGRFTNDVWTPPTV